MDRIELWATLKRLARAEKARNYVAVGYVGQHAAKLLRIGKGDVLVCPLTLDNARNGEVCPASLKAFQKRGVKIYLQSDLHAKVFLLGRKSIVGSPNLSTRSANILDEAALMTSDVSVAKRLRQWFAERMNEPLTPEWLSLCEKVYRPPKTESLDRHRKGKRRESAGRSVWLVNVRPTDYPETEKAIFDRGERKAVAELANKRRYEVESIRWVGKGGLASSIRKGDLLVEIWEDPKGHFEVCPHGRLVNISRTKTKRAWPVTYLYLEMPRNYRTIKWMRFKRACRDVGLTAQHSGTRRIRDIVQARKILSMVSPEKLTR